MISRHQVHRFADHPLKARIETHTQGLNHRKPAERRIPGRRFRGAGAFRPQRLVRMGQEQVPQVQMLMFRILFSGGDFMDVEIEWPGGARMQSGGESRFLCHLSRRYLLSQRLSCFTVTARLEPLLQLCVKEKQNGSAIFGHHEPGTSEVSFGDGSVETVRMIPGKTDHAQPIRLLPGFGRTVSPENVLKSHGA